MEFKEEEEEEQVILSVAGRGGVQGGILNHSSPDESFMVQKNVLLRLSQSFNAWSPAVERNIGILCTI